MLIFNKVINNGRRGLWNAYFGGVFLSKMDLLKIMRTFCPFSALP